MKKSVLMAMAVAVGVCCFGCTQEKNRKDRSQAEEMYGQICKLVKEYTDRLEVAPDSADWAEVCTEFEEKLDKISFSYPPDTDLLLTEGQNDTIHALMQDYVRVRGERIHGLMHPMTEADTLINEDTLTVVSEKAEETIGSTDASRSHGN